MRAARCELHRVRLLRAFALERENGLKAVACVLDAYRSSNVSASHAQLRALGLSYTGKRSLNVCRVHLELLNAVGWRVLVGGPVAHGHETARAELDLIVRFT